MVAVLSVSNTHMLGMVQFINIIKCQITKLSLSWLFTCLFSVLLATATLNKMFFWFYTHLTVTTKMHWQADLKHRHRQMIMKAHTNRKRRQTHTDTDTFIYHIHGWPAQRGRHHVALQVSCEAKVSCRADTWNETVSTSMLLIATLHYCLSRLATPEERG